MAFGPRIDLCKHSGKETRTYIIDGSHLNNEMEFTDDTRIMAHAYFDQTKKKKDDRLSGEIPRCDLIWIRVSRSCSNIATFSYLITQVRTTVTLQVRHLRYFVFPNRYRLFFLILELQSNEVYI